MFGALGKIDQTGQDILFGATTAYPVAATTTFQLTGNYLNYGAHLHVRCGTAGQQVFLPEVCR